MRKVWISTLTNAAGVECCGGQGVEMRKVLVAALTGAFLSFRLKFLKQ